MYQMIYRTSINLYRYEYCIEKTDRYTALLYRRAGTIGLASDYTLGIYADGYIVFAFPFVHACRSFVCSFVCSFVTFRHVRRIYLKVFG